MNVQATRPKAGARELAEEMEREDTARGPEPEPEGRSRSGMGGRRLGRGDTPPPLTAAESERLGDLAGEYDAGMRRYAVSRLMVLGMGWDRAGGLADDVVQQMWLEVARRHRDALVPELPEAVVRMRLCRYVKDGIWQHLRRADERVRPVDLEDGAVCALVCALMVGERPATCGGPGLAALPGYLARMVEGLPETERAALLLFCDGVPYQRAAERLGCGTGQMQVRVRRALLLLQLDNPELGWGVPVAVSSLSAEQRELLGRLSPGQREVLLRLTERERDVLLLSLGAGLKRDAIAERLGISRAAVVLVTSACAAAVAAHQALAG
ncbi:sigma factor-like helix-turn-helix DNA-binding protein [Streptomyces sp. NPDC088135]|uniref:sigma factor-like helix-turn-helix DNA-binding protein n=1 Tax=Streptomyces sp. NPDC088135 TaxID=3160993 RepID=UPI0034234BC8